MRTIYEKLRMHSKCEAREQGATKRNHLELIQVAIVDDQRVSREGLRLIIDGTPGYRCTQTFETVEDGLHGLAQETPDVLLLDIHLPGMGGSEGVLLFRRNYPSLHVVMLSYLSDDDHVFQSICNGACGYILKKTPPDRLLQAISDAMTGGTPLSPEIARRIINFLQKAGSHNKFRSRLTRNELGLLELLAQGYTNQSAAEKLGASINTIRDGMRSIYEKIHWHLKSEARSEAL